MNALMGNEVCAITETTVIRSTDEWHHTRHAFAARNGVTPAAQDEALERLQLLDTDTGLFALLGASS